MRFELRFATYFAQPNFLAIDFTAGDCTKLTINKIFVYLLKWNTNGVQIHQSPKYLNTPDFTAERKNNKRGKWAKNCPINATVILLQYIIKI
jgi:hypothetical protein